MHSALWAAKTGLDAQQTRLSVVSHNLANVSTNGFKKDRAVFEDLLYQNVSQVGAATSQDSESPTGLNIGTGVRIVATEKNYTQGGLNNTGNSLDVAINGRGFFRKHLHTFLAAHRRANSQAGQLQNAFHDIQHPKIIVDH